jgi:serine/threonine-protein kinase
MGKLKKKSDPVPNNKNNSRFNHLRNKFLVATGGVFLAFVLILMGLGTMFTVVNNLKEQLVDIPVLVGKPISDIEADPIFNKNFILKKDLRYDDTIAAGIIIDQDPGEGKFATGKEISVVVSRGKRMVNVPDLRNVDAAQAVVQLKELELLADKIPQPNDTVPEGQVIKTEPAELTNVPVGTTVKLYVSFKTTAAQVKVPEVVGMTKARAVTALQKQNLYADIQEIYNDSVPVDEVISQSIEKDTVVDTGTQITIYVSKGSIAAAIADGTYVEPADPLADSSEASEEENVE